MPIQELEDQLAQLPFGAGLPKLADIRKGTRNEQTGAMTDLDHFRVVFTQPFADLQDYFVSIYGANPVMLPNAFLIGDTRKQAFIYNLEEHTKTRMIHQCDGVTQSNHFDKAAGRNTIEPAPCERPACKCDYAGRMMIMLPDFSMETGYMGYFMLHSSSFHDIQSINKYLNDLEQMNRGKVSGFPLIVGRAPHKISTPKPGTTDRMRLTKWLIYLMPDPGYTQHVLLPSVTKAGYGLAKGEMTVDDEIVESAAAIPANVPETVDEQPVANVPETVDEQPVADVPETVDEQPVADVPETVDEQPVADVPEITDADAAETELAAPTHVWDRDIVENKTAGAFEHPNHQTTVLGQMISSGELKPDMTTEEAVIAVLENRRRRTAEKVADLDSKNAERWNADPKAAAKFIAHITKKFSMKPAHILTALNQAYPYSLQPDIVNVMDFQGSIEEAIAGCIAYYLGYDKGKLGDYAHLLEPDMLAIVAIMYEHHLIPF